MPLFRTKKEPFEWIKNGEKTIDIRKGYPLQGEIAVYLSGRNVVRLSIVRCETGGINEVIREDNFRLIIPSAKTVDEAITYVGALFEGYSGVFTAYYVSPLRT